MLKKYYINHFTALCIAYLIFACEPNTPKANISIEETTQILEELNFATALVSNETSMNRYDQQALLEKYKEDIFEKHDTNEEEFLQVLEDYASYPNQIYGIIQVLKDTITTQKNRHFERQSAQ